LLNVKNLSKTYAAGDKALDNVSFSIPSGQVVGLIGPSGAGKSTLIRCVNRLVEPSTGSIELGETTITGLSTSELRAVRRRVGMIFQEYALVERLTVMENVLSGRLGYVSFWRSFLRRFPAADVQKAKSYLTAHPLNSMRQFLRAYTVKRIGKLWKTRRVWFKAMPDMTQSQAYPTTWKRPPVFFQSTLLRYIVWLLVLIWFVLALGTIEVNWARVAEGMERGWRFIKGFLTPDFTTRWRDISQGLVESLTMTLTSTVVGVVLSVPIGIGAARNVAPKVVYYVCRSIIAVSRSLQEIIIAILFVAMFGFGPFAGFLTLSFATIGFMSKLLAEDIEDIDESQTEAIRSTGASWLQLINYAVQPQVMPRLIGLSLYRLDINFRESAVIGIVGAGGIGATLNTAIDRYEFDSAGAILLIIIAIVMITEYSSGYVRRWVQ